MKPVGTLQDFQKVLNAARRVVILTGAGISAESGIPTFRGSQGLYEKNSGNPLNEVIINAVKNPLTIMKEVRDYRYKFVETKLPNAAHMSIANLEKSFDLDMRRIVVITQNVDDLHRRAGTQKLIQLHGSLFETKCIKCKAVADDSGKTEERFCYTCGGLLRPNVVWFGEPLNKSVLEAAETELMNCDLCLIVGTSSLVYPAARFAPEAAKRGVPVAEFNLESTHVTKNFEFFFRGTCVSTLPEAFGHNVLPWVQPNN